MAEESDTPGTEVGDESGPGPIRWMAKNGVASNLLMAFLVVGGLIFSLLIKQEVFPEFDMDWIRVSVPYPGASPQEAEEGIVTAIEEAMRGVDGIDRVNGSASEGIGSVYLKLRKGANPNKVLTDVKNAVDRVTSFPQEAEKPIVNLFANRREVITLVIHGQIPQAERVLVELAEQARDELLGLEGITVVELAGVRKPEMAIEIPEATLRTYGFTLQGMALKIRQAALDLPGGSVKTSSGEVLLRLQERAQLGEEFGDIVVQASPEGTKLRLADIATIRDTYEDKDEASYFNGEPAVMLSVYRTGDQTPLKVAAVVKRYKEAFERRLPPGVSVAVWQDWSEMYRDRIDLLLRNAYIGLLLVLLVLGLFLELRLAFWVTLGIPISFLGSILLMPFFDVSFNMISLFAFIVTLGMVVDDAIVVGENIHDLRQTGMSKLKASIVGARQVAVPVTFSILTSVIFFMPMLFVPGVSGKLFGVIPAIVISVLLISLVESLFVLPAHLSHGETRRDRGVLAELRLAGKILLLPLWPAKVLFESARKTMTRLLAWFIGSVYAPFLKVCLTYRYATLGLGIAVFALSIGMRVSGHLEWNFMPKIENDRVIARVTLPFGTPFERTKEVQRKLVADAKATLAELGGMEMSRGIYTLLGAPLPSMGPVKFQSGLPGSHRAAVTVRLVPIDKRDFNAAEFTKRWRTKIGTLPGVEKLNFTFEIGMGVGAPIHVRLAHRSIKVLERAAAELAEILRSYPGVKDVDPGFSQGKPQLDFKVSEAGKAVGLTGHDVGRQVRAAFFGAEAIRQQRGRHELRVMVRLPKSDRESEYAIEELMLRTPDGGEIPFREAATVRRVRADKGIGREDGRRVIHTTAEVESGITSADKVLNSLKKDVLPQLEARYPGLKTRFGGARRSQQESMGSLMTGFMLALLAMYGLLAIPFRSYFQPLVVMSAIPFGIVGAFLGHMLMGFEISIISLMGVVALSGVVVNDSLVLVHTANRYRDEGMTPRDAIEAAGQRRFRPILLTSLTTFLGLAPMIFETSVQARFLVPMAVSLGFGVLFATFIILIIVPSSYVVIEDIKWLFGIGRYARKPAPPESPPDEPDDSPPSVTLDKPVPSSAPI